MRAFGIAVLCSVFCFMALSPVQAAERGHDIIVTGLVKSVDTHKATLTVNVPVKGDMAFRISPDTQFDTEILGGIAQQDIPGRLGALRPGTRVSVTYLTLPPGAPVASKVAVHK